MRTSDGRAAGTAWNRLRPPVESIAALLGLIATGLTLAAYGGAMWWALDLTTHFRVHYFGGLFVAALLMWLARRRRLAVLFTVACLLNLGAVAPQYFPRSADAEATGPALRLMQMNVRFGNRRHDLVAAAIRRNDPDVLVLQEVNDRWIDALSEVLADYPYAAVRTRGLGIGVFSRHELEAEVRTLGDPLPSVVARLSPGDAPLTLIATHPLRPSGGEASRRRDDQLAALAEYVGELDGPVIVLGDLNATPWSAPFRALLRDTGLRDASRGRGLHATWPASLPLLRIPIDHCLHSAGIEIAREAVGSNVGSDHSPLIIDAHVRSRSSGLASAARSTGRRSPVTGSASRRP